MVRWAAAPLWAESCNTLEKRHMWWVSYFHEHRRIIHTSKNNWTAPAMFFYPCLLGLFDRQKCPKGKHCNFLHVFRNPTNEFWEADRDLHLSPDRSVRGSRRDDRSWRQRRRSRSPMRSERSFSWREAEWRRSARAGRSERRSGWCRSRSRSRSRSRRDRASRSRSRSRRDRASDTLRSRSRDKKRYRSRSKGRDIKDNNIDTPKKAREKSRSSSREGKRSPKKPSRDDETPNGNKSHRRHKKSKKKKSKKHKKKSRRSEEMSSSGESDSEEDTKQKTAEGLRASSPARDTSESQPVQEETELESLRCEEDGDKSVNPEVKSEHSDTELERGIINVNDISTS